MLFMGSSSLRPNGNPLHVHKVSQRNFQAVIAKAGLPRLRFHDLRHLHASYGARAGVPAKVKQQRLGHATPGFTMQVYTHTLAGQQEAAARSRGALAGQHQLGSAKSRHAQRRAGG